MMKKRTLYAAAVCCWAAGAFAQTDDGSLNREMTIEKDFTPMVRDASKINLLPTVELPASRKTEANYSDWAVPAVPSPRLQLLPAAVPAFDTPFYRKRGYADVALGNYWNASASAGYRLLDREKDVLNVWFRHQSTHGKLRFLDGEGRTHQKRSDNRLHAGYRHLFRKAVWRIEGDYRFDTFNYYGRGVDVSHGTFLQNAGDAVSPAAAGTTLPDLNRMQEVHRIDAETEIASSEESGREWDYRLSAGYHRYQNRMGLWYGEKGVAENRTEVQLELGAPMQGMQRIAVAGRVDNLVYDNRCAAEFRPSCPDNYTMITLNPYYRLQRSRLMLRAGATVQLSFHNGAVVRLSPDVRLNWEFARRFFLFSDVTGGKQLHTFASLSERNVYANPSQLPRNSYVPVNWTAGLRTNALNCLWAEVSGGIRYVEGDLFDAFPAGGAYAEGALPRPAAGYVNRDAFVWHVGGEVRYTWNRKVNVSAAWRHEIRTTDALKGTGRMVLSSSRPDDLLTLRVEAETPMKPLSLYTEYFMGRGRGALLETEAGLAKVSLGDIHEWNVGAMYRMGDAVHVRLRFENLLNRKYDLYYGMPSQGFRFMAGAGINF